MSDETNTIVLWVVVVAALFVALSVAIPAVYHLSQPPEYYISVEEPSVSGVANETCTFQLSSVYYHRYGDAVTIETTLLRHEDEGAKKEIQRWLETDYLPGGVNRVSFTRTVDEPLEFGTYQFQFRTIFDSPYGWKKTHEARSEKFLVHHGDAPDAGGAIKRADTPRC